MNEIKEKDVTITALIESFEKTGASEEIIDSLYEENEDYKKNNKQDSVLMYHLKINCELVGCSIGTSYGSVGFELPIRYFKPILGNSE